MVAGSPAGNARGYGDGVLSLVPVRAAHAWMRSIIFVCRRAGVVPTLIALYGLAAAALLLPWPFGAHPPWAYNWEGYTVWRWATYWEPPAGPTAALWAPNDGLMTDSGQGPLVGLPVAIGVALGGLHVGAMRLPVALLAAAAAPLLWLLGRCVAGPGPATLAALLLATSPAFLFYGRTATLVGVSLVPLLFSAIALMRVLDAGAEGWRWSREGALAASLLLGIYAYAPVRLFWPLAVALLCLAALRQRARRGVLLMTTLQCLLIVPVGVMTLERLTTAEADPIAAASAYFHARGEQLVAMHDDPNAAGQYVRDLGGAEAAAGESVQRLIEQNAADLAGLLLDRDTGPVAIDYWNEHGRLWPWFFLPFAIIGAGIAARGWLREGKTAMLLPLVLTFGLALPLLLTSRVHVGRLLPALPFALLLVASGAWFAAVWLADLARRAGLGRGDMRRGIAPLVAGLLLLPAAAGARADLATPLPPSRETRTAAAMAEWADDVRERGGAVLVEDAALGDEIEGVHAATYRLDLDQTYRFVDLQQTGKGMSESDESADSRPPLFWRGALGALPDGLIARPCERLWFVTPESADAFLKAWHAAGCIGAPDSVILP